MLPVKWSDNLKVTFFFSHLLTNANFCMFVRCFKKILNAVTSPAFYNSCVTIPTQSTLWSHTLQIIPSSTHSSKGHWSTGWHSYFSLPSCFRLGMLSQLQGWHLTECPCSTTFDMHFCYILSGWERSASDGGVFHDAHVHDLVIPPGKY